VQLNFFHKASHFTNERFALGINRKTKSICELVTNDKRNGDGKGGLV